MDLRILCSHQGLIREIPLSKGKSHKGKSLTREIPYKRKSMGPETPRILCLESWGLPMLSPLGALPAAAATDKTLINFKTCVFLEL